MGSATPHRVSEAEYLALPETMTRMELIDGELVVPPAPHQVHQHIVGRLYRVLSTWADGLPEPPFVGLAPLDVRIAPGRIVQPGLFVLAGPLELQTSGPIDRVPRLCVEVLSTNRVFDRVTKRYLYAEAGVREYWLVDPTLEHVEQLSGAGLVESREFRGTFPEGLVEGLAERLGL